MVRIYQGEGKFIDREMNDEELAQHKKDQETIKELKKVEAEKETARQAILDRLGLTADEAKLLLG